MDRRPNEHDILADLAEHGDREIDALRAYRELLDDIEEPVVTYLVEQVLDDERRHHRLIADMIDALRGDVDFDERSPALPFVQRYAAQSPIGQALVMHTHQLIDIEEADRESLQNTLADLAEREDNSLLPVLVRMMLSDTEKHIAILRYIGALVDPSEFDLGTLFEPVLLEEITRR